jgi:Beta/Gamma crystallin
MWEANGMVRRSGVLVVAAWVLLLAAHPASVRADDGLSAVLDGHPINLERVPSLSCHDFAYPVLTCFATTVEMEADVARRLSTVGLDGSRGDMAALSSGYVTVYADADYGGAAASLSHDYANLTAIGWNDRITSLKSHGATGTFFEHADYRGFTYDFGSASQDPNVGNYYNDKFSSLDID